MSSLPSHIPFSIHPIIRNLNVRQISKMIATKIIETTALQLQFNPTFCNQLDVAQHLNTYEAVAYFTDNQYFEKFSIHKQELINYQELTNELLSIFYMVIQSE